jgi:WD40 repeat protein
MRVPTSSIFDDRFINSDDGGRWVLDTRLALCNCAGNSCSAQRTEMEAETTVTALADYRPQLHPCTVEAYYQSTNQNSNSSSKSSFLCGTYELHEGKEGKASRGGSITVCTIDSTSKTLCHRTTDCKSGVLDMKISGDFVATALSQNSLSLHKINEVKSEDDCGDFSGIRTSLIVKEVASVSAENEGLFLSLDWDLGYLLHNLNSQLDDHGDEVLCNNQGPGKFVRRCAIDEACYQSANIAVSTQEGSIIVYHLSDDKEFSEVFNISEAHKMTGVAMPVWIVCFDPHSKSTLVTGGDDCIMKLWDIRQGIAPTHTDKNHNAGVTSAQWHPTIEHTFITGSYDEYVRIWDQRSLRSPVSETHTGAMTY